MNIQTERCQLTEVTLEDFDDVKLLYLNEDVRKYLGGVIEEASFQKSFHHILHQDTIAYYWVVREKETSMFIGCVSLDTHHDGASTEVSYQFLPQWWGEGYAKEVVGEVIEYAFKELRLTELVAETQLANIPSCRLLERLGMKVRENVTRYGAEQAIYYIQSEYESS